MVIAAASVSRHHCQIAPDIEDPTRFVVIDLSSTNGTELNGEQISPNQPQLLNDGARIIVGGTEGVLLRFYDGAGAHAHLVRALLIDRQTTLASRDVLFSELRRLLRQDAGDLLAAFDLDGFNWFRQRHGPIEAARLLRRLGSALRAGVHATFGNVLIGALNDDCCGAILPPMDWSVAAGHVARIRDSLGEIADPSDDPPTVSAALVRLKGAAEPEAVTDRAIEKLRQAKFAGGARSAVNDVDVFWDRADEAKFRGRLGYMRSAAVLWARHPTDESRIRAELAEVLSRLPDASAAAIAWRPGGTYWFLASDCDAASLKAAVGSASSLDHAAAESAPGSNSLGQWMHDRVVELEARTPHAAFQVTYPIARLLGLSGEIPDYDRLLGAVHVFEGAIRLLGGLLLSFAAHLHSQQKLSAATLRSLERVAPVTGAGGWLILIERLAGDPQSVPLALARSIDSRWLARAKEAAHLRNGLVHAPMAGEQRDRVAARLWATVREIGNALRAPDVVLVHVRDCQPRFDGSSKVRYQRLVGYWLSENIESTISNSAVPQGLWAWMDQIWVPLFPLLVFERCHQCNRNDVFCAARVSWREDRLELAGTIDPHHLLSSAADPSPFQQLCQGLLSLSATSGELRESEKTMVGMRLRPLSVVPPALPNEIFVPPARGPR